MITTMPKSSTSVSGRHLTVLCAAVAFVLAGGVTAATHAEDDTRVLIGMGDSYSTGAGIPPVEASSDQECQRSAAAYPMVAASELGFEGSSVACGGAVLADFTSTSRKGAPPQASGIEEADILAWTMGGNDVGGPSGVLASGSSSQSMADFAAAVDALRPQLVAAYTDVQRAAPQAQMFVLGYPDIVPASQQDLDACLGATAQELGAEGIHDNIELLNAAIAAAAATVGATFVATTASFAGHEMCTAQPYANAPGDLRPASPGASMHPNQVGHLAMAADLVAAIGGAEQPIPPPEALLDRIRVICEARSPGFPIGPCRH